MYREEDGITRDEIPRDEMLLDVCLEEVLSGQAPPDLSAQILANLQQQPGDACLTAPSSIPTALPVDPPVAAPPMAVPPVTPPPVPSSVANGHSPVVSSPARVASATRRRARVQQRQWQGYVAAAVLAFVGLGVGMGVLHLTRNVGDVPVAVINDGSPAPTAANAAAPSRRGDRVAVANPFVEPMFGVEPIKSTAERGVPWKLPYAVQPQDDARVIEYVDERLLRRWAAAGVTPSPEADDDEWCRRVFEQTIGRQPTSEELVDFATHESPSKRPQLVAQLLGERYKDEFARHWAEVWTASLLTAGERQIASREGLRQYLHEALRQEKPYDQITTELLTATGSNKPGTPDFNGATNLLIAGAANDKSQAAATVGRAFLGHQGQCAQCHDAPGIDGPSQQQFWQLASFFQQTKIESDEGGGARLADVDYVGPTGDRDEAEMFYDQPDGQRKIAYPVFIDGTHISPAGSVDNVNRRAELARLIVASEEFSEATVNQVWAKLLGAPLAGEAGSSHAELLQRLAEQFAAHDFNQKRLIEWVVLSEANARSAEGGGAGRDQLAGDAQFSRFNGPTARPEPMYESVASAMASVSRGGRPVSADQSILFARRSWNVSHGVAGDASIYVPAPASTLAGSGNKDAFVQQMIASDMTYGDKVEHLFLRALARRPTPAEAASAQRTLSYHEGNVSAALDDIWWAIVNSADYRGS